MKTVSLGVVAYPVSERAGAGSLCPVYSVTKHNGFVRSDEYFNKQVFSRDLSKYKVVRNGQFAYATIHLDEGSIGVAPEDSLVSPMYTSFATHSDLIDTEYLIRFLKSPRALANYAVLGKGSAERRRSISFDRLAEMKVPLPSLDEQRRIAAILDKADELRTKRRQALAHLDTLTQSIFYAVFGDARQNSRNWPTQNIGALLEVGPQNGMYLPASEYGSGAPIVRIDSFRGGVVDELPSLKRLRATEKDVETYGLRAGDILINRVNSIEHLGKAAVVPELEEPTVFESNMMRCRFDRNKVHPEYLRTALQSEYMYTQITRRAKRAVNQASINQTDVKAMEIRIPPMGLQISFATRVAAVERLKETHRKHLVELDTLFASLQNRAFKGEL